jgi:hypothetical protein
MKKTAIFALLVGLCATAFAQSGSVALPQELEGTWFRSGEASGLEFDTTLTVSNTSSGATLELHYSDGRPDEVAGITGIDEVSATDAAIGAVAGKAAQFPSGWVVHVDGESDDYTYLIAPTGDMLTQAATNMQDIWVKQ